MSELAKIALFAYNRPVYVKRTIQCLKNDYLSSQSDLCVFCDGPKNQDDEKKVAEVRDIVKNIEGFNSVSIIERNINYGLAKSIIEGVNFLLNQNDRIIVFEDDLLSSPYTLQWFNNCLDIYKNSSSVFSICGHSYPGHILSIPSDYPYDAYFSARFGSCGWAIWKDRWEKINWDINFFNEILCYRTTKLGFTACGVDMWDMLQNQIDNKIDSWAIRACFAQFVNNGLTLCPVFSYICNIGADGSGTHGVDKTNRLLNDLSLAKNYVSLPKAFYVDPEIQLRLQKIYKRSIFKRLKQKLVKKFCVKL